MEANESCVHLETADAAPRTTITRRNRPSGRPNDNILFSAWIWGSGEGVGGARGEGEGEGVSDEHDEQRDFLPRVRHGYTSAVARAEDDTNTRTHNQMLSPSLLSLHALCSLP